MGCSSLSPSLALLIDHLLPRRILDALTLGSVEDGTCRRAGLACDRLADQPLTVVALSQDAGRTIDRARRTHASAEWIGARRRLHTALLPGVGLIGDVLTVCFNSGVIIDAGAGA